MPPRLIPEYGGKRVRVNGVFSAVDAQRTSDLSMTGQTTATHEAVARFAADEAIAKAAPSVVFIDLIKEVPVYDVFIATESYSVNRFLRFVFQVPRFRQIGTEWQKAGGGTGVILTDDGYILTTSHVTDDRDARYEVMFQDGKTSTARIERAVPSEDLALLKIAPLEPLPAAVLGDSDLLETGQPIIALGNAKARNTLTVARGSVSAFDQTIEAHEQGNDDIITLDGLLRIHAPILPGDSGGPIIDLGGNVVAITAATLQAKNLGYAIPINAARDLVLQAKSATGPDEAGVIRSESSELSG